MYELELSVAWLGNIAETQKGGGLMSRHTHICQADQRYVLFGDTISHIMMSHITICAQMWSATYTHIL